MRIERIALVLALSIGGIVAHGAVYAGEYRGTWEQQMACTPDVSGVCAAAKSRMWTVSSPACGRTRRNSPMAAAQCSHPTIRFRRNSNSPCRADEVIDLKQTRRRLHSHSLRRTRTR